MITASLIVLILIAFGFRVGSERLGGLIAHHSYNNRANDASGAREDHLN
jgi:hypothetical protein